MSDLEIAESRYEHWRLKQYLRRLVCAGTPTRLGWVFDANGTLLGLWNFQVDRQYRRRK